MLSNSSLQNLLELEYQWSDRPEQCYRSNGRDRNLKPKYKCAEHEQRNHQQSRGRHRCGPWDNRDKFLITGTNSYNNGTNVKLIYSTGIEEVGDCFTP